MAFLAAQTLEHGAGNIGLIPRECMSSNAVQVALD